MPRLYGIMFNDPNVNLVLAQALQGMPRSSVLSATRSQGRQALPGATSPAPASVTVTRSSCTYLHTGSPCTYVHICTHTHIHTHDSSLLAPIKLRNHIHSGLFPVRMEQGGRGGV
jgi:hypothetical protein